MFETSYEITLGAAKKRLILRVLLRIQSAKRWVEGYSHKQISNKIWRFR